MGFQESFDGVQVPRADGSAAEVLGSVAHRKNGSESEKGRERATWMDCISAWDEGEGKRGPSGRETAHF